MKNTLLWLLAIFMMFVAVIYQRSTGPTYPVKGEIKIGENTYKYKLIRTHNTTDGANISLPFVGVDEYQMKLHFKRYLTDDEMTVTPFSHKLLEPQEGFPFTVLSSLKREHDSEFQAQLPVQAAAGKMEYFIEGKIGNSTIRIPEEGQDNIVLRYKNHVPRGVLIPHVFFMFFAVLLGMRAGLSALFQHHTMRKWAKISLIAMTIGGMILGPIVQKYAFGEYWTGFPYGKDFTDNKMLIMWLAWIIAMAIIGFKPKNKENLSRIVVVLATFVMMLAYLIPHSMGGSTLDYDKVDQGINPTEAIKTGKE